MFEHLKNLEVITDARINYELPEIPGTPTLVLLSATSDNKAYFNAMLRSAKNSKPGHKGKRMSATDPAVTRMAREADRKDYPGNVIVDWNGVVDSDGNEVPFSEENCADFLSALPDWLFDNIRNTASVPTNFVKGFDQDEGVEADLSKK